MQEIKIGLNMIVKNEEKVILRALESVRNIIDFAVIVDTGSTDNTVNRIHNFFSELSIPYLVRSTKFENFSQARNYALENIFNFKYPDNLKCEYFGLWMDADDVFQYNDDFSTDDLRQQLSKYDIGQVNMHLNHTIYGQNKFFRLSKVDKWIGAVHELLTFKEGAVTGYIKGMNTVSFPDGNSWSMDSKEKFSYHAKLLQDEYDKSEQKEPRNVFYLARSYDNAGIHDLAVKYYIERVEMMNGFFEERYYSQLCIGWITYSIYPERAITELLKCHEIDSFRGEHILPIIRLYRQMGKYQTAYIYSNFAAKEYHSKQIYPQRVLFINKANYDWQIMDEHFVVCTWSGRIHDAKWAQGYLEKAINDNLVPEPDKTRILENIKQLGNDNKTILRLHN